MERAFGAVFRDDDLDIVSAKISSGVADQPLSDEETRRGAKNRVKNARHEHPDAEFWVGIEGGVEMHGSELMTFAWMCIRRANGRTGEARTVTLSLPPAIRERVEAGMELGDANDEVFATDNSKAEGGAFGLLTEGRYTRESVYVEALTVALVPIVNDIYRG